MDKGIVFVVLYPGCISFEVALAAELLSKKYLIFNATPDGHDLIVASGLPLKAQLSYATVTLSNCRGILVPGGNPDSIAENKEVDRILVEADKAKIPIAAICAGPSLLGKAGILKGRQVAHGYGPEQLPFLKEIFAGARLSDELLVVDDHIITAKPEAHIDFALEIACRLGAVSAAQSRRLRDFYRGETRLT